MMLPIMLYVSVYFKEFNYNDIPSISPSIFIKRNIDIDIILLYYYIIDVIIEYSLRFRYTNNKFIEFERNSFPYSSAGLKQASEIIIVGCIPANDRRKIS